MFVRGEGCKMAVENEGFPLDQNEFYVNVLIGGKAFQLIYTLQVRLDLRPVQRFSVSRAAA